MISKSDFLEIMSNAVDGYVYDILKETGFFTAPASVSHHGNVDGGLYEHSLCVMNLLVKYTKHLGLTWERPQSPYIIGMFHDLCKTCDYIKVNGKWDHNHNRKIIVPGHGEKSVFLLQNMIEKVTLEEIICIRWHMGAFDDKENWQYYSNAVNKYPNVLYTHTADMAATHIYRL